MHFTQILTCRYGDGLTGGKRKKKKRARTDKSAAVLRSQLLMSERFKLAAVCVCEVGANVIKMISTEIMTRIK